VKIEIWEEKVAGEFAGGELAGDGVVGEVADTATACAPEFLISGIGDFCVPAADVRDYLERGRLKIEW